MALHIQDKEADRLLRDFAQERGVGLTAAIKLAVRDATELRQQRLKDLRASLEPIWAEVRALRGDRPLPTEEEEKAFMDDMWGEND